MEEKHIALVILAVIAIMAIVGLILLFARPTGALSATQMSYPGGVMPAAQPVKEYPTYGFAYNYGSTQKEEMTVEKVNMAYPEPYYKTVEGER